MHTDTNITYLKCRVTDDILWLFSGFSLITIRVFGLQNKFLNYRKKFSHIISCRRLPTNDFDNGNRLACVNKTQRQNLTFAETAHHTGQKWESDVIFF